MRIENNFTLTEAARQALAGLSVNLHFEHDSPVVLLPGDLFSIEEAMPHVFVIQRRHFHWVSPDYLQIHHYVDLHLPA